MTLLSLKTLSRALKGVRRHRKLTVLQVANRMGMRKRTYEYFEGGKGGLRLDRVEGFAQATDSDAHAILISALIGAPDLAPACAETKAITILLSTLGRVESDLSGALVDLTARDLTSAFGSAFTDLIAAGQERQALRRPTSDGAEVRDPDDPPPESHHSPDPDRRGS